MNARDVKRARSPGKEGLLSTATGNCNDAGSGSVLQKGEVGPPVEKKARLENDSNYATEKLPLRRSSLLQTAGGKGVTISEAARRKSMSVLEGEGSRSGSGSGSGSGGSSSAAPVRRSSLLQTAGGKGVTISEAARRKSMSVLEGEGSRSGSGSGSGSGGTRPLCPVEGAGEPSTSAIPPQGSNFKDRDKGKDKDENGSAGDEGQQLVSSSRYQVSASQEERELGEIAMMDASLIFTQVSPEKDSLVVNVEAGAEVEGYMGFTVPSFDSVDARLPSYDISKACNDRQTRHHNRFKLMSGVTSSNAARQICQDIDSTCTLNASIVDYVDAHLRSRESAYAQSKSKSFPSARERQEWLLMQVRWVVWTFAAHERTDPQTFLFTLVTPLEVAKAVHYRYAIYTRTLATSPFHGSTAALRSGAAQHFGRSGSNLMTPLQRCADIRALVWPLVLCFAAGTKEGKPHYEVSDGWWWVPVFLDAELHSLVGAGRLRDGCKIVVFTGGFTGNDDSSVTFSLQYNGVRLAHRNAPWGYVRQQHLLRGLSVSSLSASGGGVYAVRVRIVKVSKAMTRVRSPFIACLEQSEHRQFCLEMAHLRSNVEGTLESHPELSVRNALDSLCLDDAQWALDVLDMIDSGGHACDLTAEQEQALPGIVQAVQAERMRLKEGLLRDLMEHLDVSSQSYRDVLVRCETSGTLAWLRVAQEDSQGGATDSLEVGSWAEGQAVLVTNLKPQRSRARIPLFQFGTQSTIQTLSTSTGTGTSGGNGGGGEEMHDPVRRPMHLRALMNSLLSTSSGAAAAGQEVSFCGKVLCWEERAATMGVKSAVNDVRELEVVLTDPSRALVVLKWIVPALAMKALKWLARGCHVEVVFALVEHVDTQHEVVVACKMDRTSICAVDSDLYSSSSSSSSISQAHRRQSTGSYRPGGANAVAAARRRMSLGFPSSSSRGGGGGAATTKPSRGHATNGDPNRRKSDGSTFALYPTVSADAKSTAAELALQSWQLRATEEETRRWAALKANSSHFAGVLPQSRMYGTRRHMERGVTLVLAPPAAQNEPDGLLRVRLVGQAGQEEREMVAATSLLEQSKGSGTGIAYRRRPSPSSSSNGSSNSAEAEKDRDAGTSEERESLLSRLRGHQLAVVDLSWSPHVDSPAPALHSTEGEGQAQGQAQAQRTPDGAETGRQGGTIVYLEECLGPPETGDKDMDMDMDKDKDRQAL